MFVCIIIIVVYIIFWFIIEYFFIRIVDINIEEKKLKSLF